MASLSTLPIELLDRIIELVVLDERQPPPDVETAQQNRAKAENGSNVMNSRINIKPMICSLYITPPRYEETQPPANATGLLRASHLLRSCALDVIKRLYPDGIAYKLDVMLVDEYELWATWLHVPVVTKRPSSVDVALRIFGSQTRPGRSAFRGGDGGPPMMYWTLYHLLERFLRLGLMELPSPIPPPPGSLDSKLNRRIIDVDDIGLCVKAISIEVSTGDKTGPTYDNDAESHEKWRSTLRPHGFDEDDDVQSREIPQMHPQWLAGHVMGGIGTLLGMSYHTSSYGKILYDRVDSFKVHVQDSPPKDYSVGTQLARIRAGPDAGSEWYSIHTFGHVPGGCRLLTFWNWKYAAVQERIARGLEMPDAVEWPTYEKYMAIKSAVAEDRRQKDADSYDARCDARRCRCSDTSLENMLRDSARAE